MWSYDKLIQALYAAINSIYLNQYRLGYTYALNALLYSMANMRNMHSLAHFMHAQEIEEKILEEDDGRFIIQEVVILCDYWTRRSCYSYNQLLDGNSSATYMLSGATRFIAAYMPHWDTPYRLTFDQKLFYLKCYLNERNIRWKFLLLRTLAYTDLFTNMHELEPEGMLEIDVELADAYAQKHHCDVARIYLPSKAAYDDTVFLAYDNVPATYELFIAELKH